MFSSAYWLFGSSRRTSLNASSARSTNPPRLKSRPRQSRMCACSSRVSRGRLQQALVNVDGARDLPLLAIQAAEQQMDFERVAETLRGLAQLLDCEIDLVRHEEVQADDVVQRFRERGGDRSAGRRAVCSVPTLSRPSVRSEAQRARRGTGNRRSKQLCPPEVVEVQHAGNALGLAADHQRRNFALLHDQQRLRGERRRIDDDGPPGHDVAGRHLNQSVVVEQGAAQVAVGDDADELVLRH